MTIGSQMTPIMRPEQKHHYPSSKIPWTQVKNAEETNNSHKPEK